jgi:hypothetical protein
LMDYQRIRVIGRYQLFNSLSLNGNIAYLNNENPDPNSDYRFRDRQNTLGLFWSPGGGRRLTLLTEYTRSTVRSEITYIAPQFLQRELSFYRENAHMGTALLTLSVPAGANFQPRVTLGGTFFTSAGSRPSSFYQPLARLGIPFGRRVEWNSEWRWFSLSQAFYVYEGFRNHQFTTGFRLTM